MVLKIMVIKEKEWPFTWDMLQVNTILNDKNGDGIWDEDSDLFTFQYIFVPGMVVLEQTKVVELRNISFQMLKI